MNGEPKRPTRRVLARDLARYAIPVLAVASTTLLKNYVAWLGRTGPPVGLYLGAVMVTAAFAGTGPGLLATLLSCAATAYFFTAPYGSFAIASPDEAALIVIAGVEGVVISGFAGLLRRRNDELHDQLRERERAEEALRLTNRRLLQSQRMQLLGEFAGGVAHDFNNMLMIVLACVDVLGRRLPEDHPAHADLVALRGAADRATLLARRLLTFARRRSTEPKLVDLHECIEGFLPILRRMTGPSVTVDLDLRATKPVVLADRAELEQVIANLAANGRDAMPQGGTLTIATLDAHDGAAGAPRRVEVAVRDTGVGMDRATAERVFEPFFTTKDADTGTGLGLSVVFGVVRGLGGEIAVESAPGKGAVFRLALPVASTDSHA